MSSLPSIIIVIIITAHSSSTSFVIHSIKIPFPFIVIFFFYIVMPPISVYSEFLSIKIIIMASMFPFVEPIEIRLNLLPISLFSPVFGHETSSSLLIFLSFILINKITHLRSMRDFISIVSSIYLIELIRVFLMERRLRFRILVKI